MCNRNQDLLDLLRVVALGHVLLLPITTDVSMVGIRTSGDRSSVKLLPQVHLASYPNGAPLSQLCRYVEAFYPFQRDGLSAGVQVKSLVKAALAFAPGQLIS